MLKFITKSILIYLLFLSYTYANIINVFEFTAEELETLDVRKVKKLTTYTLGSNNNGNFIKAEAKGVGSGLGKKIEIDKNDNIFMTGPVSEIENIKIEI